MLPFADRLAAVVKEKRTPLVVGLDPRWDLLPPAIQANRSGGDRFQIAAAFQEFCCAVIDATASMVGVVKPQWAFFEQLGSAGISALEQIVAHARANGLLVIADAKRGDIGSTSQAYAEAFFRIVGPSPFCDAVTINPYLGVDSWQPIRDLASERGAGLFLLVKTSNPGSADLQDLATNEHRVYEVVAKQVEAASAATKGEYGFGTVGAVVGATHPQELASLRARMPSAWILVPGFGAQGATAADTAGAFDDRGLGAIVNSSRGILFAHREPRYGHWASRGDWQRAIANACQDSIEQLRVHTNARKLV